SFHLARTSPILFPLAAMLEDLITTTDNDLKNFKNENKKTAYFYHVTADNLYIDKLYGNKNF
ncbi:hypothetical protein CDW55_12345, partial [Chryseobacterium sp. VAUSW3]